MAHQCKRLVHGKRLAYNAIIFSGSVLGSVKLTRDNKVIWIITPHQDWDRARNEVDLSTKLLPPLDAAGNTITDPEILNGSTNHS